MNPIKGNITTQLRLIKTLIKIRHLNINVQLLFVYYHVLTHNGGQITLLPHTHTSQLLC